MGDISLLDVGSIVGPPYAITDVFPSLGPITGGTQVRPFICRAHRRKLAHRKSSSYRRLRT